ncbi:MAG TPA: hypothetical protein VMC09_00720 [Anaerolineales bacterium]|nr:hypothetical protein [Anaerolineales bacterium]
MREWTLSPGDPLALTLAADFRLCTPDYFDDQIWELEPGGGDPPALALRTTFGLRARSMRIFPRFSLGAEAASDPAAFPLPPRLRRFFPNFLLLDFSPLPGIDVLAEYWIPDSHSAAGRFTITNRGAESVSLLMELCGQLAPLEGQPLAAAVIQSVNTLAGRTSGLAPVVFLTGGPQAGPGPYPSLTLDLALAAGGSRTLTWGEAALSDPSDSFEAARRAAARPWEAELTRIEMINTTQTMEIRTGDPDWDAALALSQTAALRLFFAAGGHQPFPSFVMARQPDQGRSNRGDGSDYPPLWNGQPALEAYYLAGLLPGAPELAAGLLRNFLATQTDDGWVDWKPGLAGQRGRWLATPLLASLAWKTFRLTQDLDFLKEVQPGLKAFLEVWYDKQHDRDHDGFPEWDNPAQTGYEDNPAFTVWQAGGQGAEISAVESPTLAAMLVRETQSLAEIARALGQAREGEQFDLKADGLRVLAEECWEPNTVFYHNRDRDTHRSQPGKVLGTQTGPGRMALSQFLRLPSRLLIRVEMEGQTARRPEAAIYGQMGDAPRTENLERMDFQWGTSLAVATSRKLYTRLNEVEISGVEPGDRVSVHLMDCTAEDITLLLPLWGGIPNPRRARTLVSRTVFAADRFGRPFGLPACPGSSGDSGSDPICQAVHLPWNTLIGEGLLAYGLRDEAAQLTARLMSAVIQNLKKGHAFARAYHAESGAPIGERNPLHGLAPLGLFLAVLGVEIQSPTRLVLSGKNPFPWPVTVKYRGLTVTRQVDQSVVVFPDGQTLTLNDPTDAVVSAG